MEPSLRPFEIGIIEKFKTFSTVEAKGGKATPRKGVWIRDHLLDVEEDYVYRMFLRWQRFVAEALTREAEIPLGDYTAFKTYVWLLKTQRLIIPTRKERGKSTKFLRQYYRVNPDLLQDPRWFNPYGEFPSWREWRERKFK